LLFRLHTMKDAVLLLQKVFEIDIEKIEIAQERTPSPVIGAIA